MQQLELAVLQRGGETPTPELDLDSGVDAYETPDASRIGSDDKEYSAREWR